MSTDYILQINNLVKYFPINGGILGKQIAKVHAVDDVTFTLEKGKTLGLVGESGCGKSTLGRTILRLIEPTSGSIIFEGKDITNISQKDLRPLRKEFQIVFQDPFASLNPRMSIKEILSEPFEIHNLYKNKNERLDKIVSLLKEVGLSPESIDRYPHEFSGGQRQRIGIARALSLNPKIIICDEPVSALDVSIQSQILNLMMDLRDKYKLSYIFIAHDLSVIEHISDNVAVMYLGKIVEYTSSENLYKNPLHPYTQALISSIPRHNIVEKRERQVLQGDIPSPINPPSGCRFHTRCPFAKEICTNEVPNLKNLGTTENPHHVSCHFSKEIKDKKIN
ncbi:dipeptide ABC transporter ATP-binding protein [Silvanigrella paludirubra]|uniref:Dipeptide ABC transporter ATP-binding protein n=1 Tax=Silvanigrella paludirubra TaxID=2499159 RepID=A0A6N6VT21_9BACT|nr:dipeptide ABC transporter ATP-binding protein [Silvanigrella paludirubra]KAB8038811.1 dipeptide ABC transporter ATP-binding protein [Silvanigrella paludirubra]